MAAPPSFEELLAPIDDGSFRDDHLGRHALRLPARRLSAFEDLDVRAFIAASSHVDVIRSGIASAKGDAALPDGCSIRIRRLQVLDGTVEKFARGLAAALREEVNVNAYLSPDAETPGLAAHTDPYDLFVVQLRGSKHWELLGDPDGRLEDTALVTQGAVTTGTRGELDLGPGEVLYLPRGLRHRARNLGPGPSLHLTVSILVKTTRSGIAWLATELERRLAPHRPLPLGASHDDYDAALAELEAAAMAILGDPERVAAFLAHRDVVEYEGIARPPDDEGAERPRR